MTVCANCGNKEGPFYRVWTSKDCPPAFLPPICKNTFRDRTRITKCVERREKIDYDKYKEQQHAYA